MDFRAALIEETKAFGDVIRDADPATPVPTCPGWTVKQVFKHVGRGDRWSAQIVAQRLHERPDPRDVPDGKPPEGIDAAMDWLNAGAQMLLDAVDHVRADTKVWTLVGQKPAGWWVRRRVHETTVHRADVALAIGAPFELSPELAADGITETIDRITVMADRHDPPLARGATLHLHATDDGLGPTGEWMVIHDEDGLNWSHDHGKGDVALRGRAVDLLLVVTRRLSTADAGVEVLGDAAVWQDWVSRTAF